MSSLVSGIYKLACPEDQYVSLEETEHRLRRVMGRLVKTQGVQAVVDQIRASQLGTEIQKAWLVLTAYAEDKRGLR